VRGPGPRAVPYRLRRERAGGRAAPPARTPRPHPAVHTGHGTNTSTDLYWGSGNYIWNNDKDKATLKRNNGSTDATCSYNNSRASYTTC